VVGEPRAGGQAGQAEEGQGGGAGAEGQYAEEGPVRVLVAGLVVAVEGVVGVEVVVGADVVVAAEAEQAKHELTDQEGAARQGTDKVDGFHEGPRELRVR